MTPTRNPLDAIALIAPSYPEQAWNVVLGLSEVIDDVVLTFDYSVLDSSTRDFVQQKTGEIKAVARRAAEDIVTIGKALIAVKATLKHGRFGEWLQAEFGWSHDTAANFMNVARRYGQIPNYSEFAPTVLYMLAAPSTSDPAINEAVSLLRSGRKVDVATAKEIIHRHRAADEAAAIDLIIDTAPGGKLANALETTHIKAVAEVAQTITVTGTVNGSLPLAEALKPAVIEQHYELMRQQEAHLEERYARRQSVRLVDSHAAIRRCKSALLEMELEAIDDSAAAALQDAQQRGATVRVVIYEEEKPT